MITYVRGLLASKIDESPRGALLVVDVQGMGYEVLTNQRSIRLAPSVGDEVQVFTSLVVREDAMTLVGFMNKDERDLFNILQSASGVGVRVALALLSDMTVTDIVQAVVSEEHKPLTVAKGVGPKLAKKIVLDLKEKMRVWRDVAMSFSTEIKAGAQGVTPIHSESFVEAETVLLSLGYEPNEVLQSLKAVQKELDDASPSSEVVLRESLRWLANA